MDLSIIHDSRELISDLIQICAWGLIIYKLYRRPETEQNDRIEAILARLEKLETDEMFKLRTSIKFVIKRQFIELCMECLERGYTTISDSETIETLYQEYHEKYGMNGRGADLYRRVLDLPMRKVKTDKNAGERVLEIEKKGLS